MKNQTTKYNTDQIINTWKAIRQKYPDAIILVRNEESYFTFESDAEVIKKILALDTAKQKKHHALFSFYFHQLDSVLSKLVKAGYRIAVCDQL